MATLLARDGFCPVPYELAAAPSDGDAHFRAYGVEPGVTGPYGLDTCSGGSKNYPPFKACVERDAAQFAVRLLDKTHEWQFVRLRNRQAFNPPTWQHGSSPSCGPCTTPSDCPCATHVFFLPLWPGIGGQWLPELGGIQLPSDDDWNKLTPSAPISEDVSWPLAVLAHEYFHEYQFAWARHEPNLDPWTTQFNGLPPWKESATAAIGETTCLDDYQELLSAAQAADWPEQLCVSAGRLGALEPAANGYLRDPSRSMLLELGMANHFWRYAMEQFAVPMNGRDARPYDHTDSDFRNADPTAPLGVPERSPDEGVDLLRHVLDTYAAHPTVPPIVATDLALREHMGRGLGAMALDAQTAALLKEYSDLPDALDNPRFHLEWVGNPNVGASQDYFPDQPRPSDTGKALYWSLDKAKAYVDPSSHNYAGRLPMVDNPITPSPYDYLVRPSRLLDDLVSLRPAAGPGSSIRVSGPPATSQSSCRPMALPSCRLGPKRPLGICGFEFPLAAASRRGFGSSPSANKAYPSCAPTARKTRTATSRRRPTCANTAPTSMARATRCERSTRRSRCHSRTSPSTRCWCS